MHVVQVDGHYIGINHEDHPDVLEVLCDECEVASKLRRLMREHHLQAPHRVGQAHGPKAHDGTTHHRDA